MNQWTTLSEIIDDFGLDAGISIQQARDSLLQRVKTLHPDYNKGIFQDKDAEATYYKTVSASRKLDQMQHASMSIVPYTERAITQWAAPPSDLRAEESKLKEVITNAAELKYRSLKIRSAGFP